MDATRITILFLSTFTLILSFLLYISPYKIKNLIRIIIGLNVLKHDDAILKKQRRICLIIIVLMAVCIVFTFFRVGNWYYEFGRLAITGIRLAASFTDEQHKIEMIHVHGGTFTMGCTPEQENDCRENEKPAHEVTLSNFCIGKFEVTQAQWKSVMGADNNRSRNQGDNLPVEMVGWNDIQEFIKRLNEKTGENYRLPTEAEWEYAARGGNKSRGYKYSGSNNVEEVAWYYENSEGKTHPVGTKRGNELGIYDMSGNVFEWVEWIGDYSDNPQTNPQGAVTGQSPLSRGGGISGATGLRVSFRNDSSTPPNFFSNILGFRLALSCSE